MTVSTTTTKHIYSGNGATTEFSYTFPITDPDDIVVILTDTSGVEDEVDAADYTVDEDNMEVVMDTAPASGETLTIKREVDLTQETDFNTQGSRNLEVFETAYDKAMMAIQQLKEELDRCIKFSISSGVSGVEIAELEAGAYLLANEDADGIIMSTNEEAPTTSSLADPLEVSVAGFTPDTVHDKTYFVQGDGGAIDVSANPQLGAGSTVGQKILLVGCSETNTLILEDGTGLALDGPWTGELNDTLNLVWNGSVWVETARTEKT